MRSFPKLTRLRIIEMLFACIKLIKTVFMLLILKKFSKSVILAHFVHYFFVCYCLTLTAFSSFNLSIIS